MHLAPPSIDRTVIINSLRIDTSTLKSCKYSQLGINSDMNTMLESPFPKYLSHVILLILARFGSKINGYELHGKKPTVS